MLMYGIIYKITNLINGKIYIGQTNRTFEERVREHKKRSKNPRFAVECAFFKYGMNNFLFELIDKGESQEELDVKEIDYISTFKCNHKKFGYNELPGGKNSKHSESTKNKIKKAHEGKKKSVEHIQNMKRYWTEERRRERSEKMKGIVCCNKEQLERLAASKRGKVFSNVTPIKVLCLNNNKMYDTCKEACKDLNISSGNLSNVLNGKYTHTKGYKFQKIN